ncbi:hypothetical protein [Kamptonema formosum]|uniref:hypothetical protein n=1 Tax=Kamptonema formosum TaxID=331992 RepID=UPI00034B1843|nr:hypothetical protein [Oscillatoria sp. PCC 10802]
MSFTYLKKNCPICAGARTDCRQSAAGLIHCRDTGANPPGFTLVGVDKIGFGMWADSARISAASFEQREQWGRERKVQKQQRLREEKQRRAAALTEGERDAEIQKILAQLDLKPAHREDLRRRGLSDAQIEAGQFRSVKRWQRLRVSVHPKLPGVAASGHSLTNTAAGYLCPIRNYCGQLIGWQLRADGGKYQWPFQPHLRNGEWPLQVARPVTGTATKVGLIEGTLKPWIAAQLSEQIILGAAGGQFLQSREQLPAALHNLCVELNTPEIILYPDAEGVKNPQVYQRDSATLKFLQSQGFVVKVANWGQLLDKNAPDFDELLAAGRAGEISYLTAEAFLAMGSADSAGAGSDGEPDAAKYLEYQRWLAEQEKVEEAKAIEAAWGVLESVAAKALACADKLMRRWGYQQQVAAGRDFVQNRSVWEYTPGAREQTWQKLTERGVKYILDTSGCGSGKSHTAGTVQPADFNAGRIVYVSSEHRNPTTDTLAEWQDLEARHNGLYWDATGKLRRRRDDSDPVEVAANCGRTRTLAALRDKAIPGADAADTICTKCPDFEACGFGAVYGYRHARRETLESKRFRAHPASLPVPGDAAEWYGEAVLFWDESASFPISRQISVTLPDIEGAWLALLQSEDMAGSAASGVVEKLHWLATVREGTGRWGWDLHRLREKLGYTAIECAKEAERLAEMFAPDLGVLDIERQFGVSLADLPAGERKRLAKRDQDTAEIVRERVYKQWLVPFSGILAGTGEGYAHWQGRTLTVTLPDRRCADIAKSAKVNVILDATGSVAEWAAKLGVSISDIAVCRQEESARADVKWCQIGGIGRLGLSRTDGQHARAQKAIAEIERRHPNAKRETFDFKKFGSEGGYSWFVHSRGVNDLEDADVLILVGAPQPNLAALAAEFTAIYGRSPEPGEAKIEMPVQLTNYPDGMAVAVTGSADDDFQQFCHQRVCHEVWQAAERLRASRRHGEALYIYFLSEYPLAWPVEWLEAAEFCPEAAGLGDVTRKSLLNWIASAKDMAIQSAAAAVGCTKAYLSKLASDWGGWANFARLLRLLLDSRGRLTKSIKVEIDLVNRLHPEVESLVSDWLRLLLSEAPAEVMAQTAAMFAAYGHEMWPAMVAMMPCPVRTGILTHILGSLPPLWACRLAESLVL